MDGVIIDSESVYLQICRRLFRNLGLNIPEEEYGNFVGISNPAMWSLI
ncbi:MAG: phosphatase, partial [Bacillota bacterium]